VKLFVANLPFTVTDAQLRETFEQFGEVFSSNIKRDRETTASRGFGFVKMVSDDDARRAIAELNGRAWDGRILHVREAEERGTAPNKAEDAA
jgi:RNA recognition motif-containing protein